jgi:hypothetical protein
MLSDHVDLQSKIFDCFTEFLNSFFHMLPHLHCPLQRLQRLLLLPAISRCHGTIHLCLDVFLHSDVVILRLQSVCLVRLKNSMKFEIWIFHNPFGGARSISLGNLIEQVEGAG